MILLMGSIAISSSIFFSCSHDKPLKSEPGKISTTKQGILYTLDSLKSKIEWKGYKIVKNENMGHFGIINFESGEITIKNGTIESGKFVANINSLSDKDLQKHKDKEQLDKLNNHLKSGDFFEVEKYPTASYEITKVTEIKEGDYNTLLDGNLTIKGITKQVQFKANVKVDDNKVEIKTEPTEIMRDEFGIKFQMNLADILIKNNFTLQIDIVANKK